MVYFCSLPLKRQLPTLIPEPVGQQTRSLPQSDAERAKLALEQAARNSPSPDPPASQSRVATCHPFHPAETTAQAQKTKPAGICSPSDAELLRDFTPGDIWVPAGLCRTRRQRHDAEPRTSCRDGNISPSISCDVEIKNVPFSSTPLSSHPSATNSRCPRSFWHLGCCREGSVCSLQLFARGTSRSPSRSSPASTALTEPVGTTQRTRSSLSLSLTPASSPSAHRRRFDVSGCDDNTLAELVISPSGAGWEHQQLLALKGGFNRCRCEVCF